MTFEDRKKMYEKIEWMRGRPLITYITSSRPGQSGVMGLDAMPEICEQIKLIPNSKKEVDLLIVSSGGDPVVAWRVMSLLRERFDNVGVLVPYNAHSAATLLAFGADEVFMHPFSSLGPIDPQIVNLSANDRTQFSVEDLKSYVSFVENDLKIEREENKIKALEFLCEDLKPINLGMAKKYMNFSESLASNLLSLHMDEEAAIEISNKFNNYCHHGYTIGRKEAIKHGLPIMNMPSELGEIIWEVWCDAEKEMKCKEPYVPLKSLKSREDIMKELHQKESKIVTMEDTSLIAIIESIRTKSIFMNDLTIRARRQNLNIDISVDYRPRGWVNMPI